MTFDLDDPARIALDKAREIVAAEGARDATRAELESLQRRLTELDALVARLRDEFATIVRSPSVPRTGVVGSHASRIEAFLSAEPQRVLDVSEIHGQFADVDIATLRSTLARLDREERIVKVSRGRYAGRGYSGARESDDSNGREADPV